MGICPRTLPPTRIGVCLAVAAIASCVCAVGCGLEVGGLEEPDAASVSGATTVSDAVAGPPFDAPDTSVPGSVTPDAAMGQIDSEVPAPPGVDADGPDASPPSGDCDLDKDGFKSTRQGCGGTDCCDNDARTHPGEQAFFTSADACGSFDYNCNGVSEPQFAKVNCTLGILACNGSGFDQAPPACGVSATFDACNLGLGCYTTQSQQAQSCH